MIDCIANIQILRSLRRRTVATRVLFVPMILTVTTVVAQLMDFAADISDHLAAVH
jgi:hypothetical protein